jgi:hypothetical protein
MFGFPTGIWIPEVRWKQNIVTCYDDVTVYITNWIWRTLVPAVDGVYMLNWKGKEETVVDHLKHNSTEHEIGIS